MKKDKKVKKNKGANDFAADAVAGGEDDLLENPRIFVYVIGGISHHEICSIAEMQKTLSAQIVPGSNEIITPNQFLKQLEKLHKVDLKKIKQGDTTDQEEFAQLMGISGTLSETQLDVFDSDQDD